MEIWLSRGRAVIDCLLLNQNVEQIKHLVEFCIYFVNLKKMKLQIWINCIAIPKTTLHFTDLFNQFLVQYTGTNILRNLHIQIYHTNIKLFSSSSSSLGDLPPGRSKCPTTPLFSMLCLFLEFPVSVLHHPVHELLSRLPLFPSILPSITSLCRVAF